MQEFDPQEFVNKQVAGIRNVVNDEKALIAVSGGVDSTTCAVLAHRALGENLLCVTLDDAFMRTGEPERIAQLLSQPPLNLPMKILNVQKHFLSALEGLRDAEEKRKAFRETFYKTLSETARKESFIFLIQGTIRADIDETTRGIKTQHNVLSQMGISPAERYGFQLIEPLMSIYKPQVREVARHLGIPPELSERQPFPGPGLSVRVVGQNRTDKLESLKKATAITEENLAKHRPNQYFATIIDNEEKPHHQRLTHMREIVAQHLDVPSRHVFVKVFQDKATGMKGGVRHYGEIAAVKVQTTNGHVHQPPIQDLVDLQTKIIRANPSLTRVLYAVQETSQKQPYVVTIRAVQTHDFLTAEVSDIPWTTLSQTAQNVLKACSNVSCVYYDVTPKPPATIEME
ncbi:MAG: GMP synthase [Candidatus Bathyarchaeota archaeon]|nr:GMP synthase [Candidatus Bathyarchaeota archaeon]